jgi:hypothetical protein
VYHPRVYATNREIKEERAMLMLLPAEVIHSVPALAALVREVTDEGLGAAAAGRHA